MDNVLKWLKREAFTVISEPRETERVEIMRQLYLGAWTIEQWRHSWENCHTLSPSHCLAPIKWHGNQRRGRWKIRISNVLWIVIYQNPGDQDGPCIGHQMPTRKKMVVLLPFLDCHLHHWSSQCSHCQSVQLGPPQKGGKYFFSFSIGYFWLGGKYEYGERRENSSFLVGCTHCVQIGSDVPFPEEQIRKRDPDAPVMCPEREK